MVGFGAAASAQGLITVPEGILTPGETIEIEYSNPTRAGETVTIEIKVDAGEPANVYVAATSAYGLYRNQAGDEWAEGMWGPEGGPGTIWKLDAERPLHPISDFERHQRVEAHRVQRLVELQIARRQAHDLRQLLREIVDQQFGPLTHLGGRSRSDTRSRSARRGAPRAAPARRGHATGDG